MKLADFIKKITPHQLVLLAGAGAAGLLSFALIAQYAFNQHPCHLCIVQRVPYALIAALAVLSVFWKNTADCINRTAWLCVLLFIVDGGIAVYHSGVELGFFLGPSGCTNSDHSGASLEEMRAAIMNAALVPCDQPMSYFLGLSMASWNAVAAFVMAGFLYICLRRFSRTAHGS